MSADALANAVESLVAGVTVYKGKVTGTPSYPYVMVTSNFPSPSERAATRDVQARGLRVRTTVVGLTPASVRIVADKVSAALDGARPVVAGWNVGRVENLANNQDITPDRDVVLPNNNGHPLYVVIDWVATASRT